MCLRIGWRWIPPTLPGRPRRTRRASAADIERHRQEFDAWTAAVMGDLLVDGIVAGGTSRSGLVYFIKPASPDAGTLTLPIIDLDEGLRYTVRVPMPVS
jgi:hypothetical protein